MKKHKNLKNQNYRDSELESILNSLPQAELPTHIEQRILDSIRWGLDTPISKEKASITMLKWVKNFIPAIIRENHMGQRLQWMALASGIFAFFMLGTAMTQAITDPISSERESLNHTTDPLDPSLLDYFEIMVG